MGCRASVFWVSFLAASVAQADLDVKSAISPLLKVLAYDTSFDARGVGDFTVLIIAPPSLTRERDRLLEQLRDVSIKVKARPVKFVAAEYKSDHELQGEIDRTRACALLPVPETPMETVKAIWEVAQDNQMYALSLTAKMVEQLLPVGVTVEGDRPQILINEKASAAVGARFETSVLRLARIIK